MISEGNTPLRVSEIRDVAEKKKYDRQLDGASQDLAKSIWVALDQSMKKDEGIFICSGEPSRYSLGNRYLKKSVREKEEKNDESFVVEAEKVRDVKTRRPIPKHIREAVWRRYWGNRKDGKCWICGRIIGDDMFECGHIIASSKEGGDDVLNLVPICGACNKGMGTENLLDHKKRCWSHISVDSLVQPEYPSIIGQIQSSSVDTKVRGRDPEKNGIKKMSLKELGNILENLPFPLHDTLNVYYHVLLDGMDRGDAADLTAESRGVSTGTVVSGYTRSLGKTTSEIDELMQPKNSKEFRKILIRQFPEFVDEIDEFFSKI